MEELQSTRRVDLHALHELQEISSDGDNTVSDAVRYSIGIVMAKLVPTATFKRLRMCFSDNFIRDITFN